MDSIKKLKDIGIEEISRKTHIEKKHIERIINKDFENLKKINTLGFMKIIYREHGVDMSEWIKEYQDFLGDVETQEPTQIATQVEDSEGGSKFFKIILVLGLIGAAIYFSKDKILEYVDEYKNAQTETPVVVETIVEPTREIVAPQEPEISLSEILKVDQEQNTQVQIPKDEPAVEEIVQEQQIQIIETLLPQEGEILGEGVEKFTIKPKAEIWVGVVFLDPRTKKQYISKNEIVFDASQNQIITTGHGDFTINFGGGSKTYSQQAPVRLIYENGVLKEITQAQFLEINGGKNW